MIRLQRKLSEQNVGAPPTYEEAVGEAQSPVQGERYELLYNGLTTLVQTEPVMNNIFIAGMLNLRQNLLQEARPLMQVIILA